MDAGYPGQLLAGFFFIYVEVPEEIGHDVVLYQHHCECIYSVITIDYAKVLNP